MGLLLKSKEVKGGEFLTPTSRGVSFAHVL